MINSKNTTTSERYGKLDAWGDKISNKLDNDVQISFQNINGLLLDDGDDRKT